MQQTFTTETCIQEAWQDSFWPFKDTLEFRLFLWAVSQSAILMLFSSFLSGLSPFIFFGLHNCRCFVALWCPQSTIEPTVIFHNYYLTVSVNLDLSNRRPCHNDVVCYPIPANLTSSNKHCSKHNSTTMDNHLLTYFLIFLRHQIVPSPETAVWHNVQCHTTM